jgi:predicted metal-binding membrane protein
MASATLHRAPPLPTRVQVGLVALLLALAAAGWALTGDRMTGMDAGPGTDLGGLGWFAGVWVTMMAAMMLPSIAPMVLGHARFQEARRGGGRGRAIGVNAAFVAGYLVSWAVAGILGYAIFEGVRSLDLGFLAWDEAGPYVAGGVILAAALYQLTAPKDACLRHCRIPAMLLERWRPGRLGALRMGIEHGVACVGCCWALMAALFALGVMSVAWMAFVAALIAAERLLPWRTPAVRAVAVALAVIGIAVAFAPEKVPGLTIPGSPAAMPAMEMDAASPPMR